MRTWWLSALTALAILVVAGCSDSDSNTNPVRGPWQGQVQGPGGPVGLEVDFQDAHSATIDMPLQGLRDTALVDVTAEPDQVRFRIPEMPGDPSFSGTYAADTQRISGDLTQAGKKYPVQLTAGTLDPPNRPQEPKPPYPYQEQEVSYRNGDTTLAGTLTTPSEPGPFPAVLLLSGSGPQDRNGTLMGHKIFAVIADTLTRAGYAVLRVDDRGVGGTTGDLDQATYADLAADAAAGVDFLRDRPEIDSERVGLLGHSEGGYLAPLVAAAPDSGVAFAVLMAGPAVPGADVLPAQNRAIFAASGAPEEMVEAQVDFITALSQQLQVGDLAGAAEVIRQHNETVPEDQRMSESRIEEMTTPYFAAFLGYDPAPALRALQIPVLAFFGDKDLQVLVSQNAAPMRELLAANPDATVHTFTGLNHLMQPAETGLPNEYATIETTIDPKVLEYIQTWLTERFPP